MIKSILVNNNLLMLINVQNGVLDGLMESGKPHQNLTTVLISTLYESMKSTANEHELIIVKVSREVLQQALGRAGGQGFIKYKTANTRRKLLGISKKIK